LADDKQDRKDSPPRSPSEPNPTDTGVFRWYQDLMDRILPKKEKEKEPPS